MFDKQTLTTKIGYRVFMESVSHVVQFNIISTLGSNLLVVKSTNGIATGVWATIHMSYAGNSLASGVKIWINKTLETNVVFEDSLSATILNNEEAYIGKSQDKITDTADFDIDNLNVYDQALTQSNVDNDDVTPIHSYAMDTVNIIDLIGSLDGTATNMTDGANVKQRT